VIQIDEAIVIGLLVIAAIVGAKRVFSRGRLARQKTFRCARCSAVEALSTRTIEAWRAGKTKLALMVRALVMDLFYYADGIA
jgi:hypothetical protein